MYFKSSWFSTFNIYCQPVNYSDSDPDALIMVQVGWHFFFSKFVDFFDTMFFVLRMKENQVQA